MRIFAICVLIIDEDYLSLYQDEDILMKDTVVNNFPSQKPGLRRVGLSRTDAPSTINNAKSNTCSSAGASTLPGASKKSGKSGFRTVYASFSKWCVQTEGGLVSFLNMNVSSILFLSKFLLTNLFMGNIQMSLSEHAGNLVR